MPEPMSRLRPRRNTMKWLAQVVVVAAALLTMANRVLAGLLRARRAPKPSGHSWVKSGRQLTRLSKPSVKRRNTDASSLRLARAALSMPSLATLVYIRDLPVAALQQSKNEGGARP